MHIGIDCRLYGTHHRGIGRYIEQLILHLAKIKDSHHYTLFVTSETADTLQLDPSKFTIQKADIAHYGIREHLAFPMLIKASQVELMHWTHLNVPYWCPVPYVVTIHDLIVFHFPDTRATNLPQWKYKLKVWGYYKVLNNAVRKARKIITVSEFTKRDIVRHLGVERDKIFVTYLGVEKQMLGTDILRNTPQYEKVIFKKFGIAKQYIIYAGSAYPHKNLERLIDAYLLLREKYKRNWQLVLVGRTDKFYKKLSNYADIVITDQHHRNDIIFTGEVTERELDGLYRGAKCFAFPSLYEGFGLPPLEAAARATPVVAAKSSSIPEIMAQAAYYFNPQEAQSMAEALNAVGGSTKVSDEFSRLGLERAKHFLWEKSAAATVDVYNSIMV